MANGTMTVREAGKKGGQAVKEKRGFEFFVQIGRKGGEAVMYKYGPRYYSEIGKKGGRNRKAR